MIGVHARIDVPLERVVGLPDEPVGIVAAADAELGAGVADATVVAPKSKLDRPRERAAMRAIMAPRW
jgi:hypothetical protein